MEGIKIDLTYCAGFFNGSEFDESLETAAGMADSLDKKTGRGREYLGWMDLPHKYDRGEIKRVIEAAARIRGQSEYLINIGIGGSYLGAKALEDALHLKGKGAGILYAGNSLSGTEMSRLLSFIEDKEVSLNVVSKSGTTTEPAIAFRILKNHMEKRYGAGARDRIFAVTDSSRGAVKDICDREGYTSFVIPDNIGGRYSVLTPVGLLPLSAAGADILQLLEGAAEVRRGCVKKDSECLKYAAARNILYNSGKTTEILGVYENSLRYFAEWWKQLFGESEGKENKGLFPASVVFSADLHSMGQYIQQGIRNIFETIISVESPPLDVIIPPAGDDGDGLGYLSGKTMNYVNETALKATVSAHTAGGVPNIILGLPEQNERHMGQLVYFFEYACAVSGYMLGVNPFDQPGVEDYKKEMFRMLGKPGH
ncbi:MAG: glucose-6-phosphate isomerase [Clostridia bacterium]|nr:glucose-6-phosphate isomerase [Clostridia bacterium]